MTLPSPQASPPPPPPAPAAKREILRRELARRRLLDFTNYTLEEYDTGWVHREVAGLLDAFYQDVAAKRSPRLMIFLPPGVGKTELVSRRGPAFCLGRNPKWEWVSATYNQEFADTLGRDVRRIIEDQSYQRVFPGFAVRDDSNSISRFELKSGGKYMAVGIGGALTGRRAHVLAIDDPIKDQQSADSPADQKQCWEWYMAVARTRLYPGGGIVVCQTPWSQNDTSQRLIELAKGNPDADQWVVYKYPALAVEDEKHRMKGDALHPSRYSKEELHKIRASLPPRQWSALYQCNPTPDEGVFFQRNWFRYYRP